MELLEYVLFNFNCISENTVSILQGLFNRVESDDSIKEEYKKEIYSALCCARGYTLYKSKELAKALGVTKGSIKYMVDKLAEEKKLEVVKEYNISYLKPIVSFDFEIDISENEEVEDLEEEVKVEIVEDELEIIENPKTEEESKISNQFEEYDIDEFLKNFTIDDDE